MEIDLEHMLLTFHPEASTTRDDVRQAYVIALRTIADRVEKGELAPPKTITWKVT